MKNFLWISFVSTSVFWDRKSSMGKLRQFLAMASKITFNFEDLCLVIWQVMLFLLFPIQSKGTEAISRSERWLWNNGTSMGPGILGEDPKAKVLSYSLAQSFQMLVLVVVLLVSDRPVLLKSLIMWLKSTEAEGRINIWTISECQRDFIEAGCLLRPLC